MKKKTATATFGAGKREGHDASSFYGRELYGEGAPTLEVRGLPDPPEPPSVPSAPQGTAWRDRIFCASSERMDEIPDASVGLAFTSPPYNAGKDFDADLQLRDYLALVQGVAREVHRVLVPGGRYVVNVAGLGRKPYIPLQAYFHAVHGRVGFLSAGEIIWRKGQGMSGNCAWGSWRSAAAPRLRDLHEYLLVFVKDAFGRPDRGESTISREAFMEATLSVWDIPPASARRVGHPAPFPLELAERVIQLYSYRDDVVLDPFCGSGTTLVAAQALERSYVGFDIDAEYCKLAETRLAAGQ